MILTYRNTILYWDNVAEIKRLNNKWMDNLNQGTLNKGLASASNSIHTAHCSPLHWEWHTHLRFHKGAVDFKTELRKILNGRISTPRLLNWDHWYRKILSEETLNVGSAIIQGNRVIWGCYREDYNHKYSATAMEHSTHCTDLLWQIELY